MNFLVKYHKETLILLVIIAFYFILRLPNLTLQPIFADEAIYIRWAQVMRSEPTLRFLPLSDGKTPLFMWSMIPLFKFIDDPLFVGRFLSVVSGFFTLLGVFFLSKKIFNLKTAFWTSFLYVITPYTVFFDRMALVDSMLSAFTIWSLYFAIWLAQKVRLDLAMILGYLLGGAILTKTSGMVNLLLLPASILVFKREREDGYKLLKLLLFWGVAIGIALVMYNLLRLGPNFQLLSSRNADYVFSPLELVGRPLDPFIPHFRDISDWFPKLFTWPIIGLMVYGIWFMAREKNRLGLVVLLWALIPILLSMAFLKTYTARYLLPSIPLLLIFGGYGIEKISKKISLLILLVLLVLLPLHFNYQLLTNPPPENLPLEERKGYFEMWTAGYGFKEIAEFLVKQKEYGSVVVGTEGFFGTLPDGLYIYLDKAEIPIIGSHPTSANILKDSILDHQVFFVANGSKLPSAQDQSVKFEKIMEFPKAKPTNEEKVEAIILYRLYLDMQKDEKSI